MSNERIDLTQFEGMVEDLGEPCLNQDKMPLGNEWLIPHIAHLQCGYGMESDDLEQIRITVLAMSKTPDLIAELKKCYEKLDMAESALTEIWAHQIDNVGGYNVSEILLYYEKAHGLNIRPDASE